MWEIEKLKEYADVYGKAEAVMDAIAAKLRKEPEEAGKMEREMIRVIQETPMRDEYFIFYLSALIQLFPRAEYVELLLDAVSSSGQLSLQSRDYIWHNLNNYLIKHPQCESADVQRKMLELLDGIEQHVRSMVSVSRKEKAERNSARVIVMIRTFLGESHGHRPIALWNAARCYSRWEWKSIWWQRKREIIQNQRHLIIWEVWFNMSGSLMAEPCVHMEITAFIFIRSRYR